MKDYYFVSLSELSYRLFIQHTEYYWWKKFKPSCKQKGQRSYRGRKWLTFWLVENDPTECLKYLKGIVEESLHEWEEKDFSLQDWKPIFFSSALISPYTKIKIKTHSRLQYGIKWAFWHSSCVKLSLGPSAAHRVKNSKLVWGFQKRLRMLKTSKTPIILQGT